MFDPFCPCRMTNSTRIFHRSRAQLKRTECSSRIPPPEWKVEYFLNHSNAEEREDKNRTVPPSVANSSTPFPLLGRYVSLLHLLADATDCEAMPCRLIMRDRNDYHILLFLICRKNRFLSSHQDLCTTNRSIRVIRDERENRVEQFPLSTSFASHDKLMHVSSEDVFGDSGYPQNKEVVWQIELPESRRVKVIFDSFNLNKSSACGDYISIHNENGDLRKFCAQEELQLQFPVYDIVGTKITVKFVASASGNDLGFSARLV